jgi:uracil-DNA glycosylase
LTDGRALAKTYLEQQRLLGGDAVVLPGDGMRDAGDVVPAATAPTHPASPIPHPGVPIPGLTFDPPSGDLFASDPVQQAATLAEVATLVAACTKCKLCESRTNTVPGEGPTTARLVVVGEGPGRTEDETGRPFVGKAGELLTKILAAIDFPREQVFICNVVKCRPPENRLPQYDEIAACVPYLFRQLELLGPKVILAMGGTAAQTLLNTKQSLGALRNQVHRFRGTPVIVTYHPAALLRNPNWKRPTWDDVRIARSLLDG